MATELIKVSELPVMTDDFVDGDLLIVSQYNGGTYVSKSKNAFKLGLDAAGYISGGIFNLGLSASVSGNALTISLKQKDGITDPSSGMGRCRIAFRSSTITSGGFSVVDAISATNTVISSGSTAGFSNGVEDKIYVYAINNSGSIEIAWSTSGLFDEGSLYTTTAEGGSGGADSRAFLYSTTARSNIAVRLIGCLTLTEATAGTWATGPSNITCVGGGNINKGNVVAWYQNMGSAGGGTSPLKFTTKKYDTHSCYDTSTGIFTSKISQFYRVSWAYASGVNENFAVYVNSVSQGGMSAPISVRTGGSLTVYIPAGVEAYLNCGTSTSADSLGWIQFEGVGL